MSVKLRPYPEYRDSELPWLHNIPVHWSLVQMKRVFTERVKNGYPDEPLLAATQTKGVIPKDQYGTRTVVATKDLHLLKLVEPDDYVVSLRSFEGGIEHSNYRGIISPAYTVLKPSPDIVDGYFSRLLKCEPFVSGLSLFVTGIREGQNIDYDRLSRSLLPFPPRCEQRAIGSFLDAIVPCINRLIRAKSRQIELLNEQKQVIISRAVTRGLDSNVRLKPSGLDWLGDIPYHWEPTRLKYVADVQTGVTLGKKYGDTPLETRPYLRVANVQDGHLELADIATVSVSQSEVDGCGLRNGDVLMTEGGDIDKLGRGCIWRNEIPGCLHQNHIFAVRARRAVLLPEYLVLAMSSVHGRSYFEMTAKQTTNLASTNSTTLKALPLFLPGMQEQTNIVGYAAEQTSGLEAAVQRILTEVDLLHEYRTRLIADVVTGKLDVRDVELPDLGDADIAYDLGDSGFNSDTDQDDLPDAEEVEADGED
jgi:type I restriction enzyme S subunit